jgi:hypothetical protein
MKDYNPRGTTRLSIEGIRRFGMRRRHAWSIKVDDRILNDSISLALPILLFISMGATK